MRRFFGNVYWMRILRYFVYISHCQCKGLILRAVAPLNVNSVPSVGNKAELTNTSFSAKISNGQKPYQKQYAGKIAVIKIALPWFSPKFHRHLLIIMKKTTSTRNLRSGKKLDDEETVSKYFVAEILEPNLPKTKKVNKRKPVKIKYDEETIEAKKEKKVIDKWMPENWEATLEFIKEMRKHHTAPVDDMGCHTCADPNASPKVSRYQSLLALMLSSQTKDQVTHAAMARLKEHGCTPENIIKTSEEVLGKLIYPVGFWKVIFHQSLFILIKRLALKSIEKFLTTNGNV